MGDLRLAGAARLLALLERATRFGSNATAVLQDVAVLDGRTLTGLAVVAGLRSRRASYLVLVAERTDGASRTIDLGQGVPAGGRLTIPLAVPLEDETGLDLRRGLWRLRLASRSIGGALRPIPATGTAARDRRASPTLVNPRSPRTGRRYRPKITAEGDVTVQVVRYPTHAEVERVHVDGAELRVSGRIVGSAKIARRGERGGAVVVLSRPGTKRRQRFPATVTRDGFAVTIPLNRLRFGDSGEWVVRLRIGSAKPLVVRRALTDLRSPAAAHRYPVARVRRRGRVTTTYSDNTALVLRARRLPPQRDAVT